MSNFTRDDVKKWIRNNMLNECGCEEEDYSVYGGDMYKPEFSAEDLLATIHDQHGADDAMCPDTYSKVAEVLCSDPHGALEAIRPIMQHIGVGCPQSFAKALFDMFTNAQDMGIIKPFNTEF